VILNHVYNYQVWIGLGGDLAKFSRDKISGFFVKGIMCMQKFLMIIYGLYLLVGQYRSFCIYLRTFLFFLVSPYRHFRYR